VLPRAHLGTDFRFSWVRDEQAAGVQELSSAAGTVVRGKCGDGFDVGLGDRGCGTEPGSAGRGG
jgi:hypothetical protein